MFKPVTMNKVNLFILSKDLKKVTSIIYDLKLVEFFDLNIERFEKPILTDSNEISRKLLEIRSTITILKDFFKKNNKIDKDYSVRDVLKLKEELDELEEKRIGLEDELYRELILKKLGLTNKDIIKGDLLIGFVGVDDGDFFNILKENRIKFKSIKDGKRIYFYTNIKNKNLIELPFKEFYIPKYFEKGIENELSKIKSKLKLVKSKLELIANTSLKKFQIEELRLNKELSIIDIRHKFVATDNFTVLSGYVPKKDIKILKRTLEKELGNNFHLEVKDSDDDAPIKLNNPSVVNNFEALLKMYSLPKYTEFDPTILLFLVFPLFFGFILGDVIYGLISLIFFTLLKRKFKDLKDFISMLQISSISSIFFGFIFGEFMGFELHGSFYGFFNRAEDPETLLIIAVLFGLIHINLGLIVGFINELQKNIKKAVCDKASWIILELGIALLSIGIYASNQTSVIVGIIFSLLAMVLIYMGHGFIGIIEIPSFFTNIFSYARLMAVGLSSIAIAVLVNDYTQILFEKGIIGILAGILLFSFGHIFNIVLGNFEGFIHTMRLHYVEFFTKFYEGGGKKFVPFGNNE